MAEIVMGRVCYRPNLIWALAVEQQFISYNSPDPHPINTIPHSGIFLIDLRGWLHFTGHYYSSDFIVTFSWGLLPPNPCNILSELYVQIIHNLIRKY